MINRRLILIGDYFMRYSRGDIVKFRVGRYEIYKGDVQFVEEDNNIYYINSFDGWAFKVSENNIVGKI